VRHRLHQGAAQNPFIPFFEDLRITEDFDKQVLPDGVDAANLSVRSGKI
jgi:hypothetical protein